MRRFVDLHTHSTFSDGSARPEQLVALADERKLAALALTDHDTVAGIAQGRAAAQHRDELTFIAGIEISARISGLDVHMLGLGIDETSGGLLAGLEAMRQARRRRNPLMIQRLGELGLELTMADVEASAAAARGGAVESADEDTVISRLHIAQALVAKGHCRTTAEAFEKYIGHGGPGYVEKERLSATEAIELIHQADGLAFIAHPVQLGLGNLAQLELMLRQLRPAGLDGIEVFHSDHDAVRTRQYLGLARKLGLEVCGGSDYHGPARPDARLGQVRVPLAALSGRLASRIRLAPAGTRRGGSWPPA